MVGIGNRYGTPLYILFEEVLCENFARFRNALEKSYENHLICYAVKANNALAVVKLFANLGAGADVASEFEMLLALKAGIPAEKIRANGNCKSRYYLEECIRRRIVINVDPKDELETIDEISGRMGLKAKINFRLAGFPLRNVTSPAITTSSGGERLQPGRPEQNLELAFFFDSLHHSVAPDLFLSSSEDIPSLKLGYLRGCAPKLTPSSYP